MVQPSKFEQRTRQRYVELFEKDDTMSTLEMCEYLNITQETVLETLELIRYNLPKNPFQIPISSGCKDVEIILQTLHCLDGWVRFLNEEYMVTNPHLVEDAVAKLMMVVKASGNQPKFTVTCPLCQATTMLTEYDQHACESDGSSTSEGSQSSISDQGQIEEHEIDEEAGTGEMEICRDVDNKDPDNRDQYHTGNPGTSIDGLAELLASTDISKQSAGNQSTGGSGPYVGTKRSAKKTSGRPRKRQRL